VSEYTAEPLSERNERNDAIYLHSSGNDQWYDCDMQCEECERYKECTLFDKEQVK
jgi:hypothetical protein